MRATGPDRSATAWRSARARLAEAGGAAIGATRVERLRISARGPRRHAEARQMAMYLANVVFALNYTQIGLCFGRDRTTVRHACARVEDRRDDRSMDRGIAAVEVALAKLERRLAGDCGRLLERAR